MLIRFFNRGTGSGSGAVDYLVRKTDPITKELRNPMPEVLGFGDPRLTADMIDGLKFRHKYRSGVLSFAPEDAPTEAEQQELIDDFEAIAFAGVERENVNTLWVRHQHTGNNRVELHFLTPRVELSTSKSLNIAPPGWKSYFYRWQEKWNLKKGWARPDDPTRARVSTPGHTAFESKRRQQLGKPSKDDTRKRITERIEKAIAFGKVKNRADIIQFLKADGQQILRTTKKSVTIANPDWFCDSESTQAKIRLKSQTFYDDWTPDKEQVINVLPELKKLEDSIKKKVAKRAIFNREKYLQPEPVEQPATPKPFTNLPDMLRDALGARAIIPPKIIARNNANRSELRSLKASINLEEFAIAQGFAKNASKSSQNSIRLEHQNGDTIIVKPDPNGFDTFFSLHDSNTNGTIVDFVQARQGATLNEVRQILRDYSGQVISDRAVAKKSKAKNKQRIRRGLKDRLTSATKKDSVSAPAKKPNTIVERNHYLEHHRHLAPKTFANKRFKGQVLLDERNNVAFPYRSGGNGKVTGYELRNKDFKGFEAGGKKTIWCSNQESGDRQLVITESPIDALSCSQINENTWARFIATGGTISKIQESLIAEEMRKILDVGGTVFVATDNDISGGMLAVQITNLVEGKYRHQITRLETKMKDWNEDLIAHSQGELSLSVEQKVQQENRDIEH